MSGEDGTFTITEADSESVSLADTTEVDRVSIDEELTLFTTGELDGLLSFPAEFEHRSVLGLFSSGNGTRSEHISSRQVASSDGVMSNSLGNRVVQVLHIRLSHHVVITHGRGLDVNL